MEPRRYAIDKAEFIHLPYTTTIDNQPSVTSVPAAVVAVTATASGNDIAPGDVSIAFSPKLLDVLNKLASEAEAACGGRRKRQACDANQRFAQSIAEEARPGGLLDFVRRRDPIYAAHRHCWRCRSYHEQREGRRRPRIRRRCLETARKTSSLDLSRCFAS